MSLIPPLWQLDSSRFETPKILKKLASSSRKLAELKGAAASIPSQGILINSLGLQEANLYLSQQIVRSKAVYYDLLQKVRTQNLWEDWVFYMLEAVELSAINALKTVQAIKLAVMDYKHRIRERHKFYSQDLINHLFTHPYTKIEFLQRDLNLSRMTATRYLDSLTEGGFLNKQNAGRSNYYINQALKEILVS